MPDAEIAVEQQLTTKKQTTLGLVAVFAAYFTSSVFFYSLNIAAPKIAADLNGMSLYSWAISLPALASAFVTLIFGKLSDLYGRRIILVISMFLFLIGAILAAISQTFVFNIAARVILALGQGALAPLCFSVIGDLFSPIERSKWSGLLSIPAGIATFFGPTMVGMIADSLSWRCFFWILAPLALITGVLVLWGVPPLAQRAAHKIDFLGSCLLAIASAAMILSFSWAGTTYSWTSVQIIGLLFSSLILWALFLWVERRAGEPMLDPQVFTNRTFLTAAVAGFASFFGLQGIMVYYPLFLQGVQGTSAALSGQIITPFSMLTASMGIPAGFLLARTKRCKGMYIAGYAIFSGATFGMIAFSSGTALWLGVLITALAGFGVGAFPTLNALIVQFAVPRRLLGVVVGALFFFVTMGSAIAPAILGSAMNAKYAKVLQSSLPPELSQVANKATLESLADPRVLLSPPAITALQDAFNSLGERGPALFDKTVQAIRSALEASLKTVFLIGAVASLVSLLLIITIPEVSMDVEVQDNKIKGKTC